MDAEDAVALASALDRAYREALQARAVPSKCEDEVMSMDPNLVPRYMLMFLSPQSWLQKQRPETMAKLSAFLRGGIVTIR